MTPLPRGAGRGILRGRPGGPSAQIYHVGRQRRATAAIVLDRRGILTRSGGEDEQPDRGEQQAADGPQGPLPGRIRGRASRRAAGAGGRPADGDQDDGHPQAEGQEQERRPGRGGPPPRPGRSGRRRPSTGPGRRPPPARSCSAGGPGLGLGRRSSCSPKPARCRPSRQRPMAAIAKPATCAREAWIVAVTRGAGPPEPAGDRAGRSPCASGSSPPPGRAPCSQLPRSPRTVAATSVLPCPGWIACAAPRPKAISQSASAGAPIGRRASLEIRSATPAEGARSRRPRRGDASGGGPAPSAGLVAVS